MLKYIDFIAESIRTGIREKVNPFLLAAKKGSSTKVKNFIKSGVDINVQDSDKKTALMYAASEGFLMVVNSLIEAGADVNLTDSKNRTAQDIKHILTKNGFALAGIGSVTWAFQKEKTTEGLIWKPTTTVPLSDTDLELLEKLVDDLEENDDVQEVYTNAE